MSSGDAGDDCLEMQWTFSSILFLQTFSIPGVHNDMLLEIISLLFHSSITMPVVFPNYSDQFTIFFFTIFLKHSGIHLKSGTVEYIS